MDVFRRHIYKQLNIKTPPFFEGFSCGNPLSLTKDFNRFESIKIDVQYTGTGNISIGYKAGSALDVYRITVLDSSGTEVANSNFRTNTSGVDGASYTGSQTFTVFELEQSGYQNTGTENLNLQSSDFANIISTDRIISFNKSSIGVEVYTIRLDFLEGSSNLIDNNNFMLSLPCAGKHIVKAFRTVKLESNEVHCGEKTKKDVFFLSNVSNPDLTTLPTSNSSINPTYLYKESILNADSAGINYLTEGIYYLSYGINTNAETVGKGAITAETPPQSSEGKLIDYTGQLQCDNSKQATFYYQEVISNLYDGYNKATLACNSTNSQQIYVENAATPSDINGRYLYIDEGLTTKIKPTGDSDNIGKYPHFSLKIGTVRINIKLESNGQVSSSAYYP